MTRVPDLIRALQAFVDALHVFDIPYFIGGSVASSAYGLPRSTLDVDLVVRLYHRHVIPLVEHLQDAFYIDAPMIQEALRRQASFNVIHWETMLKLDVFLLKSTPYDQEAFRRAEPKTLTFGEETFTFCFATAEDVVLHKLYWYRLGGNVSERQWGDLLGVLKVQQDALDKPYLRTWAPELGVADLLERALDEAGRFSG